MGESKKKQCRSSAGGQAEISEYKEWELILRMSYLLKESVW